MSKTSNVVELFKRTPVQANIVDDIHTPTESDIRSFLKTIRHLQSMSTSHIAQINISQTSVSFSVGHNGEAKDVDHGMQKNTNFFESVTVDMLLHALDSDPTEVEPLIELMAHQTQIAFDSLVLKV